MRGGVAPLVACEITLPRYRRAAANMVPDFLIRWGIRLMLRGMLADQRRAAPTHEAAVASKLAYVKDLKTRPIAVATADANTQHYEVPAAFYELSLGHWRKYSSGYWPTGVTTLDASEVAALRLLAERADITPDTECVRSQLALPLLAPHFTLRAVAFTQTVGAGHGLRLGLRHALPGLDLPAPPHHLRLQLGIPA